MANLEQKSQELPEEKDIGLSTKELADSFTQQLRGKEYLRNLQRQEEGEEGFGENEINFSEIAKLMLDLDDGTLTIQDIIEKDGERFQKIQQALNQLGDSVLLKPLREQIKLYVSQSLKMSSENYENPIAEGNSIRLKAKTGNGKQDLWLSFGS